MATGKTKVLVCGASGFIGKNIIDRLVCRSDLEVYGTYLTRSPAGAGGAPVGAVLSKVDLTQKDEVHRAVRGMDVVIQAAAVTTGSKDVVTRPYIHVADNAIMNSNLFRACFDNRVKHVMFFSCTVMYPQQAAPVKEEDFDSSIIDKYFGIGWTKVYLEKMCEFYSRISATKFTAIRHSNIYGPYDKYDLERSHVFGSTIAKVMDAKDGTISVWGDGSEERDLLYVSDLVDFIETALRSQADPFDLVNVGYGSSISIANLVYKIIEISGKTIAVQFDLSKPTIGFSLAVNIDKARNKYGWSPRVRLEDGIRSTLKWYKKHVH